MKLRSASILCAALTTVTLLSLSLAANAQTLTILHSFGATLDDGQSPGVGASVIAAGSTLYGTTPRVINTSNSSGTVYSINLDGSSYTNLHHFGTAGDGSSPAGPLTLVGSTLYGITTVGGTNNSDGTIFAVSTNGADYTILHEFGATGDGSNPGTGAGLTLVGSMLYGTTSVGGSHSSGTIFAINPNGSGYTNFYSFGSSFANEGSAPWAALTAVGGRLYGTTRDGGANSDRGTVFAIDTNGANYAILVQFGSVFAPGQNPEAPLTLVNATLFGTTFYGGYVGNGTVFGINTNGLSFTNLYKFVATNYFDASLPSAGLTQVGSTLYGTSYAGGGNGINGTIFTINPDGSGYSIPYRFGSAGPNDATVPAAALTLVGSTLYGTTKSGGNYGAGTVFKFQPGAGSGGGNQPPIAVCHDVTVSAGANCTAVVPASAVDNGSSDPDGSIANRVLDPPGPYPKGITGVTLTVTDNKGATDSCQATITVTDTNAPTIVCHSTIRVNVAGGVSNAVVNFPAPTTGDNCGTLSVDCEPTSGSTFDFGTNLVTCTVADTAGNTNSCTFQVIVLNGPVVAHDFVVTSLKAPKKVTLQTGKTPKPGKVSVAIQNHGTTTEVIPDLATLQGLVTLNVESLGICFAPTVTLMPPKSFPVTLTPNKSLKLSYLVAIICANDPLAGVGHEDYRYSVTVDPSVLDGNPDTVPANNVCPRPPNPAIGDKGCGNKSPSGELGADVLTDVVQR